MEVEVEVISKHTIKPSSPTAENLRHYKLSFLDQLAPPYHQPLLFFFTPPEEQNPGAYNSHEDRSNTLKQSLSQVLTHFYPLAGRVKNNTYVDCNDEGAHYFEAKVIKGKVTEFISDPDLDDLHKFLPYQIDEVDELPLAVQATFFDCGGMAIGLCFAHKVADAMSFVKFISSWSAMARGDMSKVVPPQFDAAKLFPPRNLAGYDHKVGVVKKSDLVTKRYVFTASKILSLREKYAKSVSSPEFPLRPSRVLALSAFIWSRYMAATQTKEDITNKTYVIVHAVDLRTKADPPLPQSSFGNICSIALAFPRLVESDEDEVGCGVLKEMRGAISRVNSGFFNELQQNESHLAFRKQQAEKFSRGEIVPFNFTSLCRFPLYQGADFGWGEPMWVTSATMNVKNLVAFMDTKVGDGIETWVNLKREDMEKLEADLEFLSYASPSSRN